MEIVVDHDTNNSDVEVMEDVTAVAEEEEENIVVDNDDEGSDGGDRALGEGGRGRKRKKSFKANQVQVLIFSNPAKVFKSLASL